MPRLARTDVGGEVYHVINRANGRLQTFHDAEDYKIMIDALEETHKKIKIDIFSFCLMPNHWHFAVRPKENGDLGKFFSKFTQLSTQRWHARHKTAGTGHLYQGRYKSFLVQTDAYFITLMRYIEANPLRAKIVTKAEDWKWSSAHIRTSNPMYASDLLSEWPIPPTQDYLKLLNEEQNQEDVERIRISINKSAPLGVGEWLETTLKKFNLHQTLRAPGRPRK